MNENNYKLMQLIYSLMTADHHMSIEQMSKTIGMSQRTINNYLKQIRSDQKLIRIFVLKRSAYGIYINVVDAEKYGKLKEKLELSLFRSKSIGAEGSNIALTELLFALLDRDEYVRIRELADKFYYSIGSVSRYLKDIRRILESYSLELVDKPYHGIKVSGNEEMIRQLYGDLVEYRHNKTGVMNETTEYSKYYSTDYDKRLSLKSIVITKVIDYGLPISNELLKILYKYTLISYNRFNAGHHVTYSEDKKAFIRQYRTFNLAKDIIDSLYADTPFSFDENEIYCLARRIIIGYGKEAGVEDCPDKIKGFLEKAETLTETVISYLEDKEKISFKGTEEEAAEYLKRTLISVLVSQYLNDATFDLSIIFKEDIRIKGQLSYYLAFKISRYLKDSGTISLNDKAIIDLGLSFHYLFITSLAHRRKLNVVISTEYYPEENESIRYQLIKKDFYNCINHIDIQYLYKISQTYSDYDVAIFDFPTAYYKTYPMKCIYIKDLYNRDDIEKAYREILYYSIDFEKELKQRDFVKIELHQTDISAATLVRKLLEKERIHEDNIVSPMISEVLSKQMLIQNGTLIIMNPCPGINSYDIYKTGTYLMKGTKTYVDTVCFVNYSIDNSPLFLKILEILTYDVRYVLEYFESEKKTVLETGDIVRLINELYTF